MPKGHLPTESAALSGAPLGPLPSDVCFYFGDQNSDPKPLHQQERMAKIDLILVLLKKSELH